MTQPLTAEQLVPLIRKLRTTTELRALEANHQEDFRTLRGRDWSRAIGALAYASRRIRRTERNALSAAADARQAAIRVLQTFKAGLDTTSAFRSFDHAWDAALAAQAKLEAPD